jgi:LCP family protein required for cell wall assembly
MGGALARAARWLGRGMLHWLRHWPVRKIVLLGCACLVLLSVAAAGTGYEMLKHFNANLEQDDISGLLGDQPVNTHPQAENIVVIGSDSRNGLSAAYGTGLVTDQSDTLMIIHIPADRKWAEVMSIPRDSYVNIPACKMGDGQLSSPTQFKINEAFAIGNLDGNHTALGVACTIKTIEQDTGIYINHFIAVNFTGFKSMVAAVGGVYECNPTPINDPNSHLHLSAGKHLLTPTQALGYVRARYTLGDGSDLERIGRQQAFMSSLVSRVKSKLYNPLAIYRFLDAATRSLTIDKQLGGITGLYDLGQSLRGIPSDKIAFFTVPNFPRSEVVPTDLANVVWTQPEDDEIFASFRNDVPASSTLFAQAAGKNTGKNTGKNAGEHATEKTAKSTTRKSAQQATPTPAASASASSSASPISIAARTANQSICAG